MSVSYSKAVAAELAAARAKFPAINSYHEGYAVILEELDEFWDAVKKNDPTHELFRELVQVAAMCQRTAEDLGLDKF